MRMIYLLEAEVYSKLSIFLSFERLIEVILVKNHNLVSMLVVMELIYKLFNNTE